MRKITLILLIILSCQFLSGQNIINNSKWELLLSTNYYFNQVDELVIDDGSKITPRNSFSGSIHIQRNILFSQSSPLIMSISAGMSFIPIINYDLTLNEPTLPQSEQPLPSNYPFFKDSKFVLFDFQSRLTYEILQSSITVSAILGVNILPYPADVSYGLTIDSSRPLETQIDFTGGDITVAGKYGIGISKPIRVYNMKFNLALQYVRGINPYLEGESRLSNFIKTFEKKLTYVQFELGVPLIN